MCSAHTSGNRPSLIQVIISLLCFGVQSTPYLALVLASPLVMVNKAEAKDIEGWVAIDYNIEDAGGHTSGVRFIKGAKDGWDEFDHAYYEIPFPWDAHVKGVGSLQGKESDEIALPPLTDVIGSSASENFNGSIVVNGGKSVTLDNARQYLTWSISGLEGCKITIGGVDARTTNTLELGSISGILGEGEHSTASWNIKVEYVRTNGGDPNHPVEPNQPVGTPPPGRLKIDNVHKKMNSTSSELVYRNGATDGTNDSGDVIYPIVVTKTQLPICISRVGEVYLSRDERDPSSNLPFYLAQVMVSNHDGPVSVFGGDTNTLVFSFPDANQTFGARILTFQKYIPLATDSNVPDPNAVTYPVYLARDLIADGNGLGVVALPDLERKVYAGTWHNFVLRTDRTSIADYNNDGRVDLRDYAIWAKDFGKIGNSQSDLASVDSNGIMHVGTRPDGKVDYRDMDAFFKEMSRDVARRAAERDSDGN